MMKNNLGGADRIIRVIIAAILATLYFMNIISGTLGLILLVVAIVFVMTSLVGFCPIYAIFGLSTCSTKERG